MSEQASTSKGIWVTNGLLVTEIVAIIGVLIFIQGQIQTQSQRSDNLHKEFIKQIQTQSERSDNLYREFSSQIQKQSHRSDDLYKEFINLVKEVKK